MAVLRVRDGDGNLIEIPAIKGDKGEKGDRGAGVIFGSYTGNYGNPRTIDLGTKVDAILILRQYADDNEDSVGFTLRGALVTPDAPAQHRGVNIARLNEDGTALIVQSYSFEREDQAGVMYTVHMNEPGTTYRYIAFVGEEGSA